MTTILPQVELTGLPTEGLVPDQVLTYALKDYQQHVVNDAVSRVQVHGANMSRDLLHSILMEFASNHLNLFRFSAGVAFRMLVEHGYAHQGVKISREQAARKADDFAMQTGAYVGSTSAQACVDMYNRLVNQKVPPALAAKRSVEAFGLTTPQIRTLTALAADKPVASSVDGAITQKAKAFIKKAFSLRVKVLVENTIRQVEHDTLQQAWEAGLTDGTIPATAVKQWVTAADEKVCPVCGPMDLRTVPLLDTFHLPDGNRVKFPPVHVNCRCTVEKVDVPDQVQKAFDSQAHPRGKGGEFAKKPVATKVIETPQMAAFWAQIADHMNAPEMRTLKAEGLNVPTSGTLTANALTANPLKANGKLVAAKPEVAPKADLVVDGRTYNVRTLSIPHRLRVAETTEAIAQNPIYKKPVLPPDEFMRAIPKQMVAFASMDQLGFEDNAGVIRRPLKFVDQNDSALMNSVLNESLEGLDKRLREDGGHTPINEVRDAHIGDKALNALLENHDGNDISIYVAPEDSMEAWRNVLSPTGTGYRFMFPVSVVDKSGHEVAATNVAAETIVSIAGISPDAHFMPQVIKAPYGVWDTDDTRDVHGTIHVTGPYQLEQKHAGVVHIAPLLDTDTGDEWDPDDEEEY